MKKLFTLFAIVMGGLAAHAQSGEITGRVLDETGEALPYANVAIIDAAGKLTGRGTRTDDNGNYSIKPLQAGRYDVQFSFTGYRMQIQKSVLVSSDKTTFLNGKLQTQSTVLGEAEVIQYKIPIIDKGQTTQATTFDKQNLKDQGIQRVENAVAQAAGANQADKNGAISIRGARSDGTQYYINGIKVIGTPTVPVSSVEQIQVIVGGVPAQYGDATGGVVNITTKGPSGEFHGAAEVQTSRGLDAFGYTQATASILGPIARNKAKTRTLLGFSAAFEYVNQKDNNPSAIGVWQVKPSVLADIRNEPLVRQLSGTGYHAKSENLTFADLFKTSAHPNTSENTYRGTAELDFSPAKGINIAVGGTLNYRHYHDLVKEYALLNSENNPLRKELNYRGFIRFQHSIGEGKKADDNKKESSSGIKIENAYYSVQFDFEKFKQTYEDEDHGRNFFNYGYIGQFETETVRNYERTTRTYNGIGYDGFIQTGTRDTAVAFLPGTINPLGTKFTEQYYQLLGATKDERGFYRVPGSAKVGFAQNIDQISQNGALINGQRSTPVYNIWYNVGRQYNGYGVDRNDEQYHGKIAGSFDILKAGATTTNRHSIELGVEYEERVQRSYSVNPLNLWDVARTLVNTHLILDVDNPLFNIQGKTYTLADVATAPHFFATDSIYYNYTASKDSSVKQSYFDYNLRRVLGKDNTTKIDLYGVDPKSLNINQFSADELYSYSTSAGGAILSSRGYDYTGKVITQKTSLDDYFTAKNADGQFTRLQGAFKPIYAAGYIQDKFFFKDIGIVAGLRVDQYDANQYVLKDPYSLYEIKTAGNAQLSDGVVLTPIKNPTNIGDNYAVYVNKLGPNNAVVGYRNGNDWYDRFGNPTTGKRVQLESPGGIQPFVNIKGAETNAFTSSYVQNIVRGTNPDIAFDPRTSFKKYKAQYIVMPRLQFAFNVNDRAQFFAHYDVLSQRPRGRNQLNLVEYLYWNNFSTKNNPNLKPEVTIDFEFGFKQKVTERSSVTISAYYKDFRNQIQLKKYYYAYPSDYTTYENIDFGSSKGISLTYDMRRYYNFKVMANYTLQFAEGTGSDDQSSANLINSGAPNFRNIFPLSYDSRHTINLNLDYRFSEGKDYNGPTIKNSQILSNFGINLVLLARSSAPFTTAPTVTPEGTIGGGGRARTSSIDTRLGWNFRGNLKINKDFTFKVGKKREGADKRTELGLTVYLLIQNLWNAKYPIHAYRFTLNPNDDGYLQSDAARVGITSQYNPQSYVDLYRASVNDPDNYNQPRTIFLGAAFNF